MTNFENIPVFNCATIRVVAAANFVHPPMSNMGKHWLMNPRQLTDVTH